MGDRVWIDEISGFTVAPELDAVPRALPPSRRRQARPVTEAAIKSGVMSRIAAVGGHAIAKHMTGSGVRGTPDVLACVQGRMVVIECKREGESPNPAQRGQLRKWQDAGALAGWVRTVEQFDQLLDHLLDPAWRNDFTHPGDGRDASDPW